MVPVLLVFLDMFSFFNMSLVLCFCVSVVCSVLFCSVLFWSVLFWSVLVWSGLVCSVLVWSGLVWSGLVWSGLVWSGLVWSGGLVRGCALLVRRRSPPTTRPSWVRPALPLRARTAGWPRGGSVVCSVYALCVQTWCRRAATRASFNVCMCGVL